MLPVWIAYAVACGTAATGAWVVAHECGHGAFSDNRTLQDAVGFVLHVRTSLFFGGMVGFCKIKRRKNMFLDFLSVILGG